MGFTQISTPSLTELFVQQVENMILSGELQPGNQLPPARELASLMGVSRPVVSAGLIELEKMGFVRLVPRVGAFVCDYRRKGTLETLIAIMRYNGGRMRAHEIRSLMQIRTPLESLCVELVIANATDEELIGLKSDLDAIREASTHDYEATAEATFRFHHELAVLSGNILMPLLYHSFKISAIYLWKLYARRYGSDVLCNNKVRLYDALLRRDLEAALQETPGEYPRDYKDHDWPE